jgi:hypothetical protein
MAAFLVWVYDPEIEGNHWWLVAECRARPSLQH